MSVSSLSATVEREASGPSLALARDASEARMKIKARWSFARIAVVGGILVAGCVGDVEPGEDTDADTDTGTDTGTGTGTDTGTNTGTGTGSGTTSDTGCGGGCGGVAPSPPSGQCIDSAMEVSSTVGLVVGAYNGAVFGVLEENQKLPIVFGPQGGQHVWVTLRVYGDDAETFQQHSRFDDQPGVMSAFKTCGAPQWAELIDIPVFLDTAELGPKTLHVDVGPVGGDEPSATVSVPVEITAN